MKWLVAILIVVGLGYGGYQLWEYWTTFRDKNYTPPPSVSVDVNAGDELPGVPRELEEPLRRARSAGGKALGQWLAKNERKLHDPRLGWIQLDYVVLIAPSDLAGARKVFKQVKERTDPSSPVYQRVKQLEKTFE